QIWVNGQFVGEHVGGYTPFSFDITDALQDGQGELIVRVEAPLDKRAIPHGKQRSQPNDDYYECQFTASSGIWQTVWLEGRPATSIKRVHLSATASLDGIRARVELQGPLPEQTVLYVQLAGEDMEEQCIAVEGKTLLAFDVPIRQPRAWTPDDPYLYYVTFRLESPAGIDRVQSYTGLRTIEVHGQYLFLNGERLYLRGALDQGYWPESGYTAPDDQALRRDVEIALEAGFNLIRKHIKLEDPLWLYWADQLGLLVWAEPPCYGRFSEEAAATFEAQLPLMVERDYNHPSIILWGIYNEEWGLDWRSAQDDEKQEAVIRAYDLLAACDHSRPIIDDSGWNHVKTDVLDWHYYDEDNQRWRDITAALARDNKTWFGHQLGVDHWYETQLSVTDQDHSGLPLLNGEYGAGRSTEERGWYFRWQTQELRRHEAISGYIYTELYDVEHELCGLYDAQRRLKPLGCDPAWVNAETTFIFDFLPHRPGLDYIVDGAELELSLQLSHQGTQAIPGRLVWWWGEVQEHSQALAVRVEPFTITEPLVLRTTMPSVNECGTLHLQLLDEHDRVRAYAFLNVARAQVTDRS
ncbi:MAG: hypothetical protein J2P37_13585, partial [Ktedonobacteraceae bacterium]|nr:hypothetical protein [Ktedonobacteraceae bacterium]